MRTTTLIDVDNTLIDNDRAKGVMDDELAALLGADGAARFWAAYEEVRAELTVVDVPRSIVRFLDNEEDRSGGRPWPPSRGDAGVSGPRGGRDRLALHEPLAALFMAFPFADFVYPAALSTIAALRAQGPVVILSDGDQVFQPAKINRSGLTAAVDGYVLVFPHKEDHLAEVAAAFPADRFRLVEDKPAVIERVAAKAAALGGAPLETILVRQGKYAAAVPPGPWPGATHTVAGIADVPSVIGIDNLPNGPS